MINGFHSTSLMFWDSLKELYYMFKNGKTININSDELRELEMLNVEYMRKGYVKLQEGLWNSVDKRFNGIMRQIMIVFIVYLVLMSLVYYIFWSIFLKLTTGTLWMTKSMLSIIPTDIITKVKKITDFLVNSDTFKQ